MNFQVQRVRSDGVVVAFKNLGSTDRREYEEAISLLTVDLKPGESTRTVAEDSGYYQKPDWLSSDEDEQ